MRYRAIGALATVVPLALASVAFGQAQDASAPDLDGHWWLRQPAAARYNFVQGWTDGYLSAWISAQARLLAMVEEARRAVPPERSLAAALMVSVAVLQEAHPDYGRLPAHYTDQITTFFSAYPDLRHCPIGLVLQGLNDRRPLTLEGIAEWLRETWLRRPN